MEFGILGPVEVRDGGRGVALGGPRPRALLAMLLLRAGEVVPAETLVDQLYGERPPRAAAKSVQAHISRLRKVLDGGCSVRAAAGGYVLELAPGSTVDAQVFDELVERGRTALAEGNADLAASSLAEALALWRGPALAEFRYDDFAQADIARLEERRENAIEDRIDADLARGRFADLVPELERVVAEHPHRERPRRQLMLALYRAGRQAEALEAYQAARRALVDELGIEPGRELRDLHQQILRQDASLEAVRDDSVDDGPSDVFVGRERELAELDSALDHAFAGRGAVILLQGEPGIGKSRLAEELLRGARKRGARVLVGRAWEAGGAPVYWPWVQALRTYIGELDDDDLRAELGRDAADVAQLLPELRERFPDVPEPFAPDSDSARFRMFEATAAFLRRISESRPLLVFLDDVHAADQPSLLLLQFVARQVASSRIVVVGAYRDVDPIPNRALVDVLAQIAREPVSRRLVLAGFDEREVASYVELTTQTASPALVAALYEGTEGNPLFLGETVRLLSVEAGAAPIRLAIPESVRDVIGRRLGHLSDGCNAMLLLASILGREFAPAVLEHMGLAEDDVLDAVDEATAARVLSNVAGSSDRVRFAHMLIRDTLYERIPGPRRVRLHRQAVAALENRYGRDRGPHLAELAHHALAGADAESALLYAERAGAAALAVHAYEEAARLYRTALDALRLGASGGEQKRCELLLALGSACARGGDTAVADEVLREAADIARRHGLARELGVAAVEYGGRKVWGRGSDVPGLVQFLEEALAGMPEGETELRARLLGRLAGALRDEPSRDRRDALSRQAVDLARRAADAGALVNALDGRAMAIIGPDTLDECIAIATELRDVAERIGDLEHVVDGYIQRVSACIVSGDVARVIADLDAAEPLARRLGQPALMWDVCGARAMVAIAVGDFADAERLIEQEAALGAHAVPTAKVVVNVQRYLIAELRGRFHEGEAEVRGLAAAYPARPVFGCLEAYVDARVGRTREAELALSSIVVDEIPFDQEWLFAMSLLAETAVIVGDANVAALVYRALEPWAALNVADIAEAVRGSVSRYLGLLAAALSRPDDAARHFEEALAANERMGFRPWLALTQLDCARLFPQHEHAHERAQRALATFDELGMVQPT